MVINVAVFFLRKMVGRKTNRPRSQLKKNQKWIFSVSIVIAGDTIMAYCERVTWASKGSVRIRHVSWMKSQTCRKDGTVTHRKVETTTKTVVKNISCAISLARSIYAEPVFLA
jgi:hypothetical protein